MDSKEKDKLYEQAVELWGKDLQMQMLVEECAELIVAIHHYTRFPDSVNLDKIVEEMADVSIMLEQVSLITNTRHTLNNSKEYKLNRLLERVDRELFERGWNLTPEQAEAVDEAFKTKNKPKIPIK